MTQNEILFCKAEKYTKRKRRHGREEGRLGILLHRQIDLPAAALKFYQRTHRVRLKNLNTSDKKSSRKIKHKKIPRAHKAE